jgi:hypothetical protein
VSSQRTLAYLSFCDKSFSQVKILGSTLVCITNDDKLLHVYGIVIMIKKLQLKKNKERFLKIFKMKCVLISYIMQVKMKRKAMSVVKKNYIYI